MVPHMSNRLKKLNLVKFERELFKFKDGGTIAIDWLNSIPKKDSKVPILAISPGLSGNNNEGYI